MKHRYFPDKNYKAIFHKGKTLRFLKDESKPMLELDYPEFYDVSFGTKCVTGNCDYCYASASPKGKYYLEPYMKIHLFFGDMSKNQRPFQVAIGGANEPFEHPDLEEGLKAFQELDILPNITTNGVIVSNDTVELLGSYCGGVAVTCHPHLRERWEKAIDVYTQNKIKTNLHVVVSDEASIIYLKKIYERYVDSVDYIVVLPYVPVGFAKVNSKEVRWDLLSEFTNLVFEDGKLAFGAAAYEWLTNNRHLNISLYPPELFSKYLTLDDNLTTYYNSFHRKLWKPIWK